MRPGGKLGEAVKPGAPVALLHLHCLAAVSVAGFDEERDALVRRRASRPDADDVCVVQEHALAIVGLDEAVTLVRVALRDRAGDASWRLGDHRRSPARPGVGRVGGLLDLEDHLLAGSEVAKALHLDRAAVAE